MPLYIEMPKLADTMTEGTLVKWRKKIGDKISAGDIVAEVETDKATMEMESFEDGILHELLIQPGQKVPIGARMAMLLAKGEKAPVPGGDSPQPSLSKPQETPSKPSESQAPPSRGVASITVPITSSGRVKSSPLARKLAMERGVDLHSLRGSGPGGRIVSRDVLSARATPASSGGTAQAPASIALPAPVAGPGDQLLPLSGMRRVVAERLLASKTQIPHFYLHIEVDAAPLMKMRAELNAGADPASGAKLTVNDFILKAVISAAIKVPAVNAAFTPEGILQFGAVNLAVAVAVDEGLLTPVIRDAQKKSLREVSESVKDLATRARAKKLKPDEYQGGTITVSNLGAYGIEFFDAIINPPQAAIVSVGAVMKKPVVGPGDSIVAGQRLALGLSADHRVVDGAIAAQYMAELRKYLENPALLLL